MYQKIILKILEIFDFFYQKKINNFLKQKGYKKFKIFFDVGAHKGETINKFLSIFDIESIYSFEASPVNFSEEPEVFDVQVVPSEEASIFPASPETKKVPSELFTTL